MAPNKRGRNTRSGQYVQSDYDTDTANLTDMATAPPPMPPRTNEELNLSVLQRHDPSVHQILSVAPFAVVYLFSTLTQQWEKCGIEGTLFVCSLLPEENGLQTERYCVTVLNRRGLDNFQTELFSANDVEITDEYVILQVAADDDANTHIYGLWIFSEPEPSSTAQTRVINALIIQECAMRAENSRTVVPDVEEPYIQEKPSQEPSSGNVGFVPAQEATSGQQVNLLDLFAAKPPQPGAPSLASPFPSQSQQHQYFSQHAQPQHTQFPPPVEQQHFQNHPSHGVPAQFSNPQGQTDVLTNLFLKARNDYRG